ncbi:MAG: type II toxin-antitoxin system RelE/ParE family toxin [Leptolyngbyaceae cyanobacterium]|mgnify:CR=1 FL=1
MDITFKSKELAKECNQQGLLQKRHGQIRAKRIQQRLADLRAAKVLEDLRPPFPGRCHELINNRREQFSLDLDHPYRLIFESVNDPVPRKTDGGIDWTQITAVKILGVEDTHE